MSSVMEPRFSLKKAAETLGIASSTLRQWAKSGKVRHYRISKKFLFPITELERILREGERPREERAV